MTDEQQSLPRRRIYRAYAANERTYLAWVRTGVTIIALGFLLEKFNLFLAAQAADSNHQGYSLLSASAGIAFLLLGLSIILMGFYRFVRIKRALDQGDTYYLFSGTVAAAVVTGCILVFGIYLLIYLTQLV